MLSAITLNQVFLMFSALPEPVMVLLAGATLVGATVAARQFFKQLDGRAKNNHSADDSKE